MEKINESQKELAANFTLPQLAAAYIGDNFTKKETIYAKKNDLKLFFGFLEKRGLKTLGNLGQISPAEVHELIWRFMSERREAKDKIRTLRRRISSIKNFLSHLSKTQACILPAVPALDYKELNISGVKSSAPTLTIEEWRKLKEQLKQSRNKQAYPLACMAVMGGGRTFAECSKMLWKDIRTTGQYLIVVRKGKESYYLELIPELKKILMEFKGASGPEDRVFTIKNQMMHETLNVHAHRAGIDKPISFMTFRASFIKWASERGDSLDEIANATLHQNPQTLRRYYGYKQPSTISVSSILKTEF